MFDSGHYWIVKENQEEPSKFLNASQSMAQHRSTFYSNTMRKVISSKMGGRDFNAHLGSGVFVNANTANATETERHDMVTSEWNPASRTQIHDPIR